ncbi:MAG: 2-dehydropantoate 2-reductase [Synergistaceae bacterium]|nr:2-dehydropantoate 2-reductase [Synergistaceae bacterium]
MKIVIVGIGGIGGIIGAKMAQHKGLDVNFICRGETLEKLLIDGLEFRSNNDSCIVRPNMATNDPHRIGEADVVIFCVKNYSLESAANGIASIVGKKTVVIPLLNGLDAKRKLKSIFKNSDVLGGCIYVSAFVVSPGIVQQNGNVLRVLFGNSNLTEEENIKRYSGIREVFEAAGINTTLTSNIENEMWMKFIMISSLGTATSLYMRNVGELFSEKSSADMAKGLIREIISIAVAKGVNVPENIEEETLKKATSFAPETKTSMQLDFEKKNNNELEALTGYVCEEARKLGIEVPLYESAYNKLKNIT